MYEYTGCFTDCAPKINCSHLNSELCGMLIFVPAVRYSYDICKNTVEKSNDSKNSLISSALQLRIFLRFYAFSLDFSSFWILILLNCLHQYKMHLIRCIFTKESGWMGLVAWKCNHTELNRKNAFYEQNAVNLRFMRLWLDRVTFFCSGTYFIGLFGKNYTRWVPFVFV